MKDNEAFRHESTLRDRGAYFRLGVGGGGGGG